MARGNLGNTDSALGPDKLFEVSMPSSQRAKQSLQTLDHHSIETQNCFPSLFAYLAWFAVKQIPRQPQPVSTTPAGRHIPASLSPPSPRKLSSSSGHFNRPPR
jgi:hypothetical protein